MQPAVGDLNDIGVGDGFRLGLQVQPMTGRGNVLVCSHFNVADTPRTGKRAVVRLRPA
jgi:hypothetical protein